jgi:transcriptional regulator with XRE-family HTH domain
MIMSKAPNRIDVTIGQNIKRLRLARNMSQEKLGDHLKLTFQQVQKYEKGLNRCSGSRLVELCVAFGVPIQDLFYGIDISGGGRVVDDPLRSVAAIPGASATFEALLKINNEHKQQHVLSTFRAICNL